MKGMPLARHSMNQAVMKRSRDRERVFYSTVDASLDCTPRQNRVVGASVLLDGTSFSRLLRGGIYGTGPAAPIEAAVHLVGSALLQLESGRRD